MTLVATATPNSMLLVIETRAVKIQLIRICVSLNYGAYYCLVSYSMFIAMFAQYPTLAYKQIRLRNN